MAAFPFLPRPPLPLPGPSGPRTGLGPSATLPPSLLARAATETLPSLRCDETAATGGGDDGQRIKKRRPPLPPSGRNAKKPKTAQQTPPASCDGISIGALVTAERRRALDKKVAGCISARSWAAGAGSWRQAERTKTVLRCLCRELPRGSPCALHQDAPAAARRSWIEEQHGGALPVGGEGGVVVPKLHAGASTLTFSEYVRWRGAVRLPTRFYMEHVRRAGDQRRAG